MTQSKPRVRVTQDGRMRLISDSFTGFANRMLGGPYQSLLGTVGADVAFKSSPWYWKILEIPVDDAVREWRSWQAEADQIKRIEAEEKRLNVRQVVREALTLARHSGGAVILVLAEGDSEQPLRPRSIGRSSIERLVVLGRDEISAESIDRDPLSPGYRLPTMWKLTGSGAAVRVHPSRTVFVPGRALPGSSLRAGSVWGDPIWSTIGPTILAADGAAQVISDLMDEAKLDIVSIPGMVDMLLTGAGEAAFQRRWDAAARLKSHRNVLLLDGGPQGPEGRGEVWDQKQIQWGGLPDVAKTLLTIMAGAADIPVTRLIGEQKSGLSGEDGGSLRNYYDAVAARQELDIGPMLVPLDDWIIRSALGDHPSDIWYQWNPLYQMSERELAEIDKVQAETAAIYAQNALIDDEQLGRAVANRMIESGRWPGVEVPTDIGGSDDIWGDMLLDATPRTLYVKRDVLNWEAIAEHYKAQGFETTLGEDMHVTIAYSRTPIDWMKTGETYQAEMTVPAGGPRIMDRFGEAGDARVLLFGASELEWRHEMIKEAGASWDHPEYQPHITISYGAGPDDPEPWRGEILLGPEIFAEVNEDWKAGIQEDAN